MGIGVSNWRLAKAVSELGQLGVVSGTGIWIVVTRRLQSGDPGNHVRRALAHFPDQQIAGAIIEKYYRAGGKSDDTMYRSIPVLKHPMPQELQQLICASAFVEVWLAREGHRANIGMNLLEKIQLSHLPALYGALLAHVDYVVMGAGIPIQIARVLDELAMHRPCSYKLTVTGATANDNFCDHFDPAIIGGTSAVVLKRPMFFPIITLPLTGKILLDRSQGKIDGFIVEGPTAGGHNAPPRAKQEKRVDTEPVYSEKDFANTGDLCKLGLPFWLAGGFGHPSKLQEALQAGAAGVQIGTLFALCIESGIEPQLRTEALARARAGDLVIWTSATCSPSGYPFKEAQLDGTLTDPTVSRERHVCDLGALRELYRQTEGGVGYRCPAEPLPDYLRKGGEEENTIGRRCLCNTLTATIGLANPGEPPLLTLGDDFSGVNDLPATYSAQDVIAYMLGN